MLRRLVLDVLKPHDPDIATFSEKLTDVEGVESVNVSLYEIDKDVENVMIIVEGELELGKVESGIEDLGASLHSIDGAAAGERIIRNAEICEKLDENPL